MRRTGQTFVTGDYQRRGSTVRDAQTGDEHTSARSSMPAAPSVSGARRPDALLAKRRFRQHRKDLELADRPARTPGAARPRRQGGERPSRFSRDGQTPSSPAARTRTAIDLGPRNTGQGQVSRCAAIKAIEAVAVSPDDTAGCHRELGTRPLALWDAQTGCRASMSSGAEEGILCRRFPPQRQPPAAAGQPGPAIFACGTPRRPS